MPGPQVSSMLPGMDEAEYTEIVKIRTEIEALEMRIAFLYAWREVKIVKQVRVHHMTYREIAPAWNISAPRVNNIIKKATRGSRNPR